MQGCVVLPCSRARVCPSGMLELPWRFRFPSFILEDGYLSNALETHFGGLL